ncbi:YrdB family protein [Peribacillus sp. SCS-155]|uniref:YrdB family protein n=1 Tax=Peribacillus sedimenti TaxID=3115297 RepID=UPI00390631ED
MSVLFFVQMANIFLRFISELVVLIISGYWGYSLGNTGFLRWLLAIGIPLFFATVWGVLGAPHALIQLNPVPHFLLELIFFGLPIIFLIVLSNNSFALFLGLIFIVNKVLMAVWDQ